LKSLFIVLVALIAAPSIALAQTACPESADCPEGSVCQCDEEGNVIDTVEVLDLGGYDFFGTEDTDERRNVRRFDDGSVVSEFDDDNDGVIDRRWTSIRDEQGRNILFEVDEDADGTPDRRTTWTYDGDQEREQVDEHADGTVDSVYWSDSESGRMMRDDDSDADGNLDQRCTYAEGCVRARRSLCRVECVPIEAD